MRTAKSKAPASYRGAANKLAELSRNPLFIEIAAAGIAAAAGVMMRNNKTVRAAAGKVGAGARSAASETADLAGRIGQAVAEAVTNAAHRLYPAEGDSEPTRSPAKPSAKGRTVPIKAKGAMPHVS